MAPSILAGPSGTAPGDSVIRDAAAANCSHAAELPEFAAARFRLRVGDPANRPNGRCQKTVWTEKKVLLGFRPEPRRSGCPAVWRAEVEEFRTLNPRRVNQMDENRDSQVELYKAYSVEEILERRELFGGSSSSSD